MDPPIKATRAHAPEPPMLVAGALLLRTAPVTGEIESSSWRWPALPAPSPPSTY
jgi:hypothetical protein